MTKGTNTKTAVVILAAGLGTRMKSSTPKVLHSVFDRPMLSYALDTASGLNASDIVVVVNNSIKDIGQRIKLPPNTSIAIQKDQKGTADALRSGLAPLGKFKGTVIVANGDTPLITSSTLGKFLTRHKKASNALSVLSFNARDPHGYGRIVRDTKGAPAGIIEEKDATSTQRTITEVNSGVYALEAEALTLLSAIKVNAKKGEFYLTDIVSHSLSKGLGVGVYPLGTEEEFLGINSRADLAQAHEALRRRVTDKLMSNGVTFIDPASAHISPEAKIGQDTTIYPNVFIHGKTIIGKGVTVYPGVRIVDSRIKDGAVIKDSSLIEQSTVGKGAHVGPMAHLRPEAEIGDGAKIGNFVEVKKSSIGKGAKAMHLSYIGDATIGDNANIGAGTITCNYDGKRKFQTKIGKGAFIGSDTQLVAPVTVGDGAYVGAGSTITRDVEPDYLAVSRTKQKNYPRHKGGGKS